MPLSVTALKAELKALGLDAKTPGLKGDARRDGNLHHNPTAHKPRFRERERPRAARSSSAVAVPPIPRKRLLALTFRTRIQNVMDV